MRERAIRVGIRRFSRTRITRVSRARRASEHTLFACDEMSGFVTAAALVRPSKSLLDLEAKSVVKRMKEKASRAP